MKQQKPVLLRRTLPPPELTKGRAYSLVPIPYGLVHKKWQVPVRLSPLTKLHEKIRICNTSQSLLKTAVLIT